MDEYINREVLRKVLSHELVDADTGTPMDFYNMGIRTLRRMIEDIPAADVQPVKHGRWIDGDYRCVTAVCSNCNRLRLGNGAKSAMRLALYCEKCGARMDGET